MKHKSVLSASKAGPVAMKPSDLPTHMRAVEIAAPGGPEVLRLCTRTVPDLTDGEVLIRVAAAGVNRPDVVQRQGAYPPPPGASDLPGLEVAGEVVATCGDTGAVGVGQQVCALLGGGGYAEYAAVPAGQCLPVPTGMAVGDAAALPETFFTVWSTLFERAYAAEGDIVLVHGGSSGIGTTAIQLARAFGLTIYVTAGTPEKCAACLDLGAHVAINYREQDFVAEVRRLTGKRGVDVVLDMVGGDYVPRNIACMAEGGRHVSIAVQGGVQATVNLFDIMRKRLVLTGATLRPRPAAFKAALATSLRELVWPLLDDGTIKPVIFRRFALEDAAAAHQCMESGDHIGKIMLDVANR